MNTTPFFPAYPHPIQLVVCDLDGTLVQKDLSMSTAVIQTIQRITQTTQTKVVVATGRMFPSALPYAQKLGLTTPIITYQGSTVHQRNADGTYSRIFYNPVPLEIAKQLVTYCHTNNIHINCYVSDILYSKPHPIYVQEYKNTSSIEPSLTENLLEILTEAPPKLVVINNDPAVLEAMKTYLANTFGTKTLSWCQSRHNFLEITAPNVSKWNAVSFLAEQWHIPTENILCLGDEENDLSMLTQAGLGIAMGNGPIAIQQQAKVVAPSILEDGNAQALSHYVLGCSLTETLNLINHPTNQKATTYVQ
jgi:Cof subfamily protein (haloacid dehalogenase superfamily)